MTSQTDLVASQAKQFIPVHSARPCGRCKTLQYPFYVKTGTELSNTSMTEKGFYLDLAKSRYLYIDVKHSVLVESENGYVEDERFQSPLQKMETSIQMKAFIEYQ